jgi:hypothetical protein
MVEGKYATAFPLKHQQKDMRLALERAGQDSLQLPVAAAANQLYEEVSGQAVSVMLHARGMEACACEPSVLRKRRHRRRALATRTSALYWRLCTAPRRPDYRLSCLRPLTQVPDILSGMQQQGACTLSAVPAKSIHHVQCAWCKGQVVLC